MKALLKRIVARAMRPGLVETHAHLDRVEHLLRGLDTPHHPQGLEVASWRGGLATGRALRADGAEDHALTAKYRDELAFWVGIANDPNQLRATGGYLHSFSRWQRDRLIELGRFAAIDDTDDARAEWFARQSVVEIGAGPYPSIAEARWRRAVAVDPLADGYVAERLLPTEAHADEIVYIAAGAERVPLPSAFADLVVSENCLDHVSDPARVMEEMRRLLRPGGLMWLLVDLMDYSDHMHPHSFSEPKLRALIAEHGYEVVRERVSDHKSHPNAYGEYRALILRPGADPDLGPTARAHPHTQQHPLDHPASRPQPEPQPQLVEAKPQPDTSPVH